MKAKELILNIAVNLNRISRYTMDGKEKRVKQFTEENAGFIKEVDKLKLNSNFKKTFDLFKKRMVDFNDPEDFSTWANILTHRVKLLVTS